MRFDIEGGGQGSEPRWTLLDVADPGPALRGHLRKRLNHLDKLSRTLRMLGGWTPTIVTSWPRL